MAEKGRPQKAYSDDEKLEIKKVYKNSRNPKERGRLLCIKLRVVKGMPTKQIAVITEYSEGYIDIIINEYNKNGLSGILAKKMAGNHRNMTHELEEEFLKPYKEKAIAGEILEISQIIKDYSQALNGKKISKSTVYDILHRHGWRKIMPRSTHPKKATDAAIEAYKKNERENKSC